MRAHDDDVFPEFFRTGWNAGVSDVQKQYLEIDHADYQSSEDSALLQQFCIQVSISNRAVPQASSAKVVTEDSGSSSGEADIDGESDSEEGEDKDSMDVEHSHSS